MRGRTAVVLGGSVAGLCAAGVLARHFDQVVVLERDRLPEDAEHRRGVPQSKHPHFLLNSGRRAIGEIFPGFEEALIGAGGMHLMPSMDAAYCENDGWAPRKSGSMTMVYSSRVLIERVLREKVRELPTIEIREGVTVTGLRSSGGGTADGRVEGVEFQTEEGVRHLAADLVVDALGRGSSVIDWLAAAGWSAPPEKTLDAKVTYTSRWYDLPEEPPASWWWKHLVVTPTQDTGEHPDEHEFLSNFFPIEGGRAIVCMGSWGIEMPRKPDAFEAAADRVRAATFGAATRACTPTSEVHLTRSTGNKWRRFDLLDAPPVGLVCVGDAICAFNPFYAQGMSSAARSALILGEMLRTRDAFDIAFFRAFLAEQKKSLDVPWMLAMARDQAYDFATGTEVTAPWRRKLAARFSWPIFNAINAASREDAYVEQTFAHVFNLDKSLREMATDPRFWFGIVRYKVRQRLGRTVVPGGFDDQGDPPGTDFTGYTGPARTGTDLVEA
ncbi:2-polyprenyl-6-methoxyphenol hydroxylase-like FAD-dependent oxidoreductase [Actinocorallia herbida]|uniref:2-polyprenyl-6-methoxyphenol hydroxylase-like FAD-dependent oxidoreductase n=1 Tax=Actinocorallia herbida TaxID=58109 RepID=A0A3N1CWU5_9ACTN|nr:FAD-dependent monooxygenase [Actinocorallia herbida]ROO85734.1 2-polyprenyl-6-methoxyphenol hydroxylase-like FAD-dependent oxidoreductase [Actinocorallia herbida]